MVVYNFVSKYCLNTTKSLLLDAEIGLRPVSSNGLHTECTVHSIPINEFWEGSQPKSPGAPAPDYFTIKPWHTKTHFPTHYILIAWLRTTDINYLFLTTKESIWKSQMSIETDSTGQKKKKTIPPNQGQTVMVKLSVDLSKLWDESCTPLPPKGAGAQDCL